MLKILHLKTNTVSYYFLSKMKLLPWSLDSLSGCSFADSGVADGSVFSGWSLARGFSSLVRFASMVLLSSVMLRSLFTSFSTSGVLGATRLAGVGRFGFWGGDALVPSVDAVAVRGAGWRQQYSIQETDPSVLTSLSWIDLFYNSFSKQSFVIMQSL